VAEVCVEDCVERECRIVAVQCSVCGCSIDNSRFGHACDELVGETYTLGWAERVADRVAVELPDGSEIIILLPFRGSKETAERVEVAVVVGDSIERAHIHKADRVVICEVDTREILVQSRCDGWCEDCLPFSFSIVTNLINGTLFEVGAEVVVESVVLTLILANLDDVER